MTERAGVLCQCDRTDKGTEALAVYDQYHRVASLRCSDAELATEQLKWRQDGAALGD